MTFNTTTNNKQNLIEMFADRTTGESYANHRLLTKETENGNVALIAYGWLKIAEYNERRETVTVFTGHEALGSTTVTRYINDVINTVEERREVAVSSQSPVVSNPNAGSKFIGHYVDFSEKLSAVENEAVETVKSSLQDKARELFR